MGKKGDLLRAAKKEKATYHFTGSQLKEHDRDVIRAWQEKAFPYLKLKAEEANAEYREEVIASVDRRWNERAKMFRDNGWQENMINWMSYTLSLSCRVLIEQFGWKPATSRGRHTKIMKYAEALTNEINKLSASEEHDIVSYAEETYRLYNLSFDTADEEKTK